MDGLKDCMNRLTLRHTKKMSTALENERCTLLNNELTITEHCWATRFIFPLVVKSQPFAIRFLFVPATEILLLEIDFEEPVFVHEYKWGRMCIQIGLSKDFRTFRDFARGMSIMNFMMKSRRHLTRMQGSQANRVYYRDKKDICCQKGNFYTHT